MSYSGYGSGRYSSPAYTSYSGSSRRSGSSYSAGLVPTSSSISSYNRRPCGGSYGLHTSKSSSYLSPSNNSRSSLSSGTKPFDISPRNSKSYDDFSHTSTAVTKPVYKTLDTVKRSPEFSGHKLTTSKSASSIASDISDSSLSSGVSERSRNRLLSSGSQDVSSETSSRYGSLSCSRNSLNDDIEKDYKKLYEELKVENERLQDVEKDNVQLRESLKRAEEELEKTKKQLKKILENNSSKNAATDAEKKERRALERKLSEMEEEVKQIEKLRTENKTLRDENGCLIRVISKLSQ